MRIQAFIDIILNLSNFIFVQGNVMGQIYDPVDWTFEVEQTSVNQADLILKATIEDGWHIYAMDLPSDQGPLPTEFIYNPSESYSLEGKTKEVEFIKHYDPNFGMVLNYFEDEAVFKQRINRFSEEEFSVVGKLRFMVCNDEICLPPEYTEFEIKVEPSPIVILPLESDWYRHILILIENDNCPEYLLEKRNCNDGNINAGERISLKLQLLPTIDVQTLTIKASSVSNIIHFENNTVSVQNIFSGKTAETSSLSLVFESGYDLISDDEQVRIKLLLTAELIYDTAKESRYFQIKIKKD